MKEIFTIIIINKKITKKSIIILKKYEQSVSFIFTVLIIQKNFKRK